MRDIGGSSCGPRFAVNLLSLRSAKGKSDQGGWSIEPDYFVFNRVAHHLSGRAQVKFLLEIFAMSLSGLGADAEFLRDLLAGGAVAKQPEDLALAPCKSCAARAWRARAFDMPQQDGRN